MTIKTQTQLESLIVEIRMKISVRELSKKWEKKKDSEGEKKGRGIEKWIVGQILKWHKIEANKQDERGKERESFTSLVDGQFVSDKHCH